MAISPRDGLGSSHETEPDGPALRMRFGLEGLGYRCNRAGRQRVAVHAVGGCPFSPIRTRRGIKAPPGIRWQMENGFSLSVMARLLPALPSPPGRGGGALAGRSGVMTEREKPFSICHRIPGGALMPRRVLIGENGQPPTA